MKKYSNKNSRDWLNLYFYRFIDRASSCKINHVDVVDVRGWSDENGKSISCHEGKLDGTDGRQSVIKNVLKNWR